MAGLFSSPPPAGIGALQKPKPGGNNKSHSLKRAAPRFLGDDGDDDSDDAGYDDDAVLALGRKKTTAADIDRLFDDLDADNDGLGLPPPLATRKESRKVPDSTQIINDTITAFGGSKKKKGAEPGVDGENAQGEEKPRKAPRKQARVNEDRLLGDRGLRKLKDSLKGFRIKGKGHEEEDLRRLMTVYQLWAHQMYPAGTFKDTITEVEKVCKKRSLQSQMRDWRDEARGIFKPNPSSEAENHLDAREEDAEGPTVRAGSSYPETSAGASSPAGVPPSTGRPAAPKKSYFDNIPTSSPGGALERDAEMALDDNEVDDEDEAAYMAQARREQEADDSDVFGGTSGAVGRSRANTAAGPTSELGFNDSDIMFDLDEEPMGVEDEDEDLLALMEMEREPELKQAKKISVNPIPVPASANAAKKPSRLDDEDNLEDFDFPDEDEMLREMETAARKEESRFSSKKGAASFYSAGGAAKPGKASSGDSTPGKSASAAKVNKGKKPERSGDEEEEDNFDDFDFGDEEEMLRDMAARERIADEADNRHAVSASTSKTPSLLSASNSMTEPELELLDDGLEEDLDFLHSAERIGQAAAEMGEGAVAGTTDPLTKPPVDDGDKPLFEDEEDLYS